MPQVSYEPKSKPAMLTPPNCSRLPVGLAVGEAVADWVDPVDWICAVIVERVVPVELAAAPVESALAAGYEQRTRRYYLLEDLPLAGEIHCQ